MLSKDLKTLESFCGRMDITRLVNILSKEVVLCVNITLEWILRESRKQRTRVVKTANVIHHLRSIRNSEAKMLMREQGK